jgi:hypothetical protein
LYSSHARMAGWLGAESSATQSVDHANSERCEALTPLICVKLSTHTNINFIRYVWLYLRVFYTTEVRLRRCVWLVRLGSTERLRAWSWSAHNMTRRKTSHTWRQSIILVINIFCECFFPVLTPNGKTHEAEWSMGTGALACKRGAFPFVRTKVFRVIFRNFAILNFNLRSHWGFP